MVKSWEGQKSMNKKCYASASVHYFAIELPLFQYLLTNPDVAGREEFAHTPLLQTVTADQCQKQEMQ